MFVSSSCDVQNTLGLAKASLTGLGRDTIPFSYLPPQVVILARDVEHLSAVLRVQLILFDQTVMSFRDVNHTLIEFALLERRLGHHASLGALVGA